MRKVRRIGRSQLRKPIRSIRKVWRLHPRALRSLVTRLGHRESRRNRTLTAKIRRITRSLGRSPDTLTSVELAEVIEQADIEQANREQTPRS